MFVGKTYQTIKQRQYEYGDLSSVHVPSSPTKYMSQLNSLNIERPLKNNSENLSFKGLSFMGNNQKEKHEEKHNHSSLTPTLALVGALVAAGLALRLAPAYKKVGEYKISEFKEFTEKHLGPMGGELLENLKNSKLAKKMVKVDGDKITLYKKTIPQLIWDGLIYPVKVLPGDLLNGTVELLGKIKPLKNWSKNVLQKQTFKNIRQRSKIDAKVNTLRGLFETKNDLLAKLNKGEITNEQLESIMFQRKMKMFDSRTGNYDTKHERALVRVVSGLPPAIFLANDAYNLSRMMDDDANAAEEEKKIRFRQEVSRVGLNAYITLVTMGALQKYINNSKLGIMLMTAATTLVTESFSRLTNGKHITRLTPEEARLENERNHAPEAEIKPIVNNTPSFKANQEEEAKNSKEKQQKPLLSFDSLMKASAIVIAGGFAMKGIRKYVPGANDAIKATLEPFKKLYNKATTIENFVMPKAQFDEVVNVLEKNGFKDLAEKYKKVAATTSNADGSINLGEKSKKIKPLVKFIVAPFRFAWSTITLPYNLVEKAVASFTKKPAAKLTSEEVHQKILKDNIKSLATSIEKIGKEARKKGYNAKEFQSFVNDNFLKAFNSDTMSNVSNSDLSNLAKTAGTAATLWFLMTDNYNMVMLKSNGNDKDGAKTKFRERLVQEASRLFYQTLLIDLFNSTFSSQYHNSLMGAAWITATNTTLGEWLTRTSVGVPVGTHSRKGLIELEEKQNNATGFKKSYYNFMRRLTGKRSIQSYNVKKEDIKNLKPDFKSPVNFTAPQQQNVNFTNNSSVLKDLIKG